MKPIKSFVVLAIVLGCGVASAQGYYGPPRGHYGFHHRENRLAWGFSVGVGGMNDHGSGLTNCANCDVNPAALEVDAHVGGMLGPRFALLFEVQGNFQTVSSSIRNGDTFLDQSLAMVAGQYWITPQLWVKGGAGVAHLSFDNAYADQPLDIANGVALMAAVGFEIFSARFFAVDLQARVVNGSYSGIDDRITAANIGLGFNWY